MKKSTILCAIVILGLFMFSPFACMDADAAAPTIDTRVPDVSPEAKIPINLAQGAALQFGVTATDPDPGDTLTYTWELDGTELTGQAGSDLDISAIVATLVVGIDSIVKVTVTDPHGASASTQWTLEVVYVIIIPWDLDLPPGEPLFFYPIYGTAKRNLEHLADGDWIGVFDNTGTCYGAGQYYYDPTLVDPTLEDHTYDISVYPRTRGGATFGNGTNMKLYFKFYINATDEHIAAVDSQLVPRYYPDIPTEGDDYRGDPQRIDLSAAAEQDIILRPGWNFISFNVQPESTIIEEAFNSILTGSSNYLEYVASHEKYWYSATGSGNLAEVDAFNSYYLKMSASAPTDGFTLTITGLRVDPAHEFTLTRGWQNISYLLDSVEYAIKRDKPYSDSGGILSSIKDDIIWLKGATDENGKNWCSPEVGFLKLGPGRGLFIKMVDTLPDDPNDPTAVKFRYYENP